MKKIPNPVDEALLNYIDGTLSKNEAADLEAQLRVDESLRIRLETLKTVDITLSRTKLEKPSMNFTQRVMESLHQVPTTTTGLSARNGILMIVGVMAVVTILILLVSSGSFDSMGVIQPKEIGIKNFNFEIPSISINGKLLINSIIFLNLVIALIVLDRTILRPLFEKRMRLNG